MTEGPDLCYNGRMKSYPIPGRARQMHTSRAKVTENLTSARKDLPPMMDGQKNSENKSLEVLGPMHHNTSYYIHDY